MACNFADNGESSMTHSELIWNQSERTPTFYLVPSARLSRDFHLRRVRQRGCSLALLTDEH